MFGTYEILIAVLMLWEIIWKAFGLWYAARNDHSIWFVVILVVNSVGIIPIIYLIFKTDFFKFKKKAKKSRTKKK
jgi:hypothetical protein